MKLSKAIEGFLLAKQADSLSPSTAQIYKWGLDKLVDYLHDPEVDTITTDDLRRWFQFLRTEYKPQGIRAKERLAPASLQNFWRALKSFYTWGESELGLKRQDNIRRPAGESPVTVPLTQDEIRKLLHCAEYLTTKGGKRPSYTRRVPPQGRAMSRCCS